MPHASGLCFDDLILMGLNPARRTGGLGSHRPALFARDRKNLGTEVAGQAKSNEERDLGSWPYQRAVLRKGTLGKVLVST